MYLYKKGSSVEFPHIERFCPFVWLNSIFLNIQDDLNIKPILANLSSESIYDSPVFDTGIVHKFQGTGLGGTKLNFEVFERTPEKIQASIRIRAITFFFISLWNLVGYWPIYELNMT